MFGMDLKIGNRRYKVLFQPIEDEEVDGYINYTQSEICIDSTIAKDFQQETLLHEVLHGIVDDAKLYSFFSEELIEKFIEVLTPRFIQILNDNPELIKYLKYYDH